MGAGGGELGGQGGEVRGGGVEVEGAGDDALFNIMIVNDLHDRERWEH